MAKKKSKKINKPLLSELTWLTTREGAAYAREGYHTFLKRMNAGEIKCIRRGKSFLTRKDWIDEFYFSLIHQPEDTGMLQEVS